MERGGGRGGASACPRARSQTTGRKTKKSRRTACSVHISRNPSRVAFSRLPRPAVLLSFDELCACHEERQEEGEDDDVRPEGPEVEDPQPDDLLGEDEAEGSRDQHQGLRTNRRSKRTGTTWWSGQINVGVGGRSERSFGLPPWCRRTRSSGRRCPWWRHIGGRKP